MSRKLSMITLALVVCSLASSGCGKVFRDGIINGINTGVAGGVAGFFNNLFAGVTGG